MLVVRSLAPSLAPLLPGLSGMVAETGSVLSHLAVLAREYGVPTAVGVPDALRRFPPGTPLRVDGSTGAVAPNAAPVGGVRGPLPQLEDRPAVRTGSMADAYLVWTGQATDREAAVRTLAVGPPSIEQVYYVLNVSPGDSDTPPALVRGVSRLLDAPRRIKASL